MKKDYIATQTIEVDAPAENVWRALTEPALIQQYLFGTETTTDWKVGSPITWKGEWQGKSYVDKGTILAAEPGRLLRYSYLSSLAGKDDKPGNYSTVTFELSARDGRTSVTLTQDGNETDESRKHAEKNWALVLQGLKKVAENK